MEVDHDRQVVHSETLGLALHEPEVLLAAMRPSEEHVASRLTSPIVSTHLDTRNVAFERSVGHILDTRGTAGGYGGHWRSFPQAPPRVPWEPRGRSPLTPASELPLHLHIEVRGLGETRVAVRALPACSRASPRRAPSPSVGLDVSLWSSSPPTPAKGCPAKGGPRAA